MKIRNCFVSNSSTCSFCIYGTTFEQDELRERLAKNFEKNFPDEAKKAGDDFWDIGTILKPIDPIFGDLDFIYSPYEVMYVGISPDWTKDDMTFGEFKKQAAEALRKILGDISENKLDIMIDGWNDNF